MFIRDRDAKLSQQLDALGRTIAKLGQEIVQLQRGIYGGMVQTPGDHPQSFGTYFPGLDYRLNVVEKKLKIKKSHGGGL